MGWISDDGKKSERLIQSGLQDISSVSCGPFVFQFSEVSSVENTSILMKLQDMKDRHVFIAREFADYLHARRIWFRISHRWTNEGLRQNIKTKLQIFRMNVLFQWRRWHE